MQLCCVHSNQGKNADNKKGFKSIGMDDSINRYIISNMVVLACRNT